jgi:hypothetical protein
LGKENPTPQNLMSRYDDQNTDVSDRFNQPVADAEKVHFFCHSQNLRGWTMSTHIEKVVYRAS